MLNLVINGKAVQAAAGSTILEVCRQNGINIPTFCYDPDLCSVGSCRICVVEVAGRHLFPASCVAPAENGMVIETESPAIVEARRVILELLAARHDFSCHICEKNGDCRFQDYCYRYGIKESPFSNEGRIVYAASDPNPFLERDYNKCIMCTRCVRVCEEISQERAISISRRGHHAKIAAAHDADLSDSTCVFCGQCVMVCPVGALTGKVSAGKGRSYEVEKVLTTCSYCGTGCTFELNVKDDKVVGVTSARSAELSPVNKGALCVKGRFGWDFIQAEDRLTSPLIKENGSFREASWDEALDLVASRFQAIKAGYGAKALAVFTSARISNEENYLAQKFTRAVLGTNNIDHCARL